MGRQLAVIMAQADEHAFTEYLAGLSEIRLVQPFADTPEKLVLNKDHLFSINWHTFYIHPVSFSWDPVIKRSDNGLFYADNISRGPLLEVSRPCIPEKRPGRIYWAAGFAAPDGLRYDLELFALWYNKAAGWIRKNCRLKWKTPGGIVYVLAEGYGQYQSGFDLFSVT